MVRIIAPLRADCIHKCITINEHKATCRVQSASNTYNMHMLFRN